MIFFDEENRSSIRYSRTDTVTSNEFNTQSSVVKFYLRLEAQKEVITIQPTPVLTLFGSWGALWGSITIVFGTIAFQFNYYRFHRTLETAGVKDLRNASNLHFDEFGNLIKCVQCHKRHSGVCEENTVKVKAFDLLV